jgi:hypothetical protein
VPKVRQSELVSDFAFRHPKYSTTPTTSKNIGMVMVVPNVL